MSVVWGERSFVEVDGVRVHVERRAGEGAPIGLLHGFGFGTSTWAGLAPLLDEPLVAWDRPPFGWSDAAVLTLDEELEVTAAVLADVDAPLLIGHSAGTVAALQATLAGVVAPRGLVLVSPALTSAPPAVARAMAGLPGMAALGTAALRLALPRADVLLRRLGRHRTPLIEAIASETARSLGKPGTAEAMWELTARWQPPGLLERLDAVDVPTLVITGSEDRVVTPVAQTQVAEALGATHIVLAGSGHAPHEERPESVHAAIREWLPG